MLHGFTEKADAELLKSIDFVSARSLPPWVQKIATSVENASREKLAVRTQDVAELPVDLDCVLRSFVNHSDPPLEVFRRIRLRDQIAGLHDSFEGVAEFMRQSLGVRRGNNSAVGRLAEHS